MMFGHVMAMIMFFVLAANLLEFMHHWRMLPDENYLFHRQCMIFHAAGAMCSAVAMILWAMM